MMNMVGKKLPNGALVLAVRPARPGATDDFIVLADTGAGSVQRYVTWRTDVAGNAYWGHYNADLAAAAKEYTERRGS